MGKTLARKNLTRWISDHCSWKNLLINNKQLQV